MKFTSRIAGLVRSLFGQRPRLGIGLVAAVTVMVPLLLWGQSGGWQGSSPVYVNPGVNVGIGTTNPAGPLDVSGSSYIQGTFRSTGSAAGIKFIPSSAGANWEIQADPYGNFFIYDRTNSVHRLLINGSGNVGIGTTTPGSSGGGGSPRTLEILGQSGSPIPWGQLVLSSPVAGNANDILGGIEFASRATTYTRAGYVYCFKETNSTSVADGRLEFGVASSALNSSVAYTAMTIKSSGNVGIGIANPQSRLAVNGAIQATQVTVTATPADYVFDPNYRLKPLHEVASYIKTNRHLPDIPSGKEVAAKGVNLGDMQSKLLAKVEELTLHMIAADERNNRLERQSLDLEKQNRDLRQRIAHLEAASATR